jgi:hypothetical protein
MGTVFWDARGPDHQQRVLHKLLERLNDKTKKKTAPFEEEKSAFSSRLSTTIA